MKNNNKISGRLVILCIVVIAVIILGCVVFFVNTGKEDDTSPYSDQTNSVEENLAVSSGGEDLKEEMEDEDTVVWTVPEFGKLKKSNVDYLNELLEKDGNHLKLAVRTIDADEMETYNSNMKQLLKDGKTDIVYTGMCEESEQLTIPLIEKGYLEKLDSYLETPEGKELKQAFHQAEWDAADFGGSYYVVPAQDIDRQVYVAFNKDYIPEDKAKKYSGDWTELLNYLSDDMEKEEGFVPLAWTMDTVDALEAYGYQQVYGLVGDIGKGTFCHPLETQECYDLLKFLHTAVKKGYLGKNCNLIDLGEVADVIQSGKYAVLAGYSQGFISEYRDNLTVIPVKNCKWRLDGDGCTGICSASKKKEKAFRLLSLLYTDERYANALAYGKEGADYDVQDGYVSLKNDDMLDPCMYGLYDLLLPKKGNEFTPDIHKNKKKYFDSDFCQKSEFLKFHPDMADWADEISEAMDLAEDVNAVCKASDFDKAYQNMKEKRVKASQELKKYLQEQFDQWKKNKK